MFKNFSCRDNSKLEIKYQKPKTHMKNTATIMKKRALQGNFKIQRIKVNWNAILISWFLSLFFFILSLILYNNMVKKEIDLSLNYGGGLDLMVLVIIPFFSFSVGGLVVTYLAEEKLRHCILLVMTGLVLGVITGLLVSTYSFLLPDNVSRVGDYLPWVHLAKILKAVPAQTLPPLFSLPGLFMLLSQLAGVLFGGWLGAKFLELTETRKHPRAV